MATALTVTLSAGVAQSVTVDVEAYGAGSGIGVTNLGDGIVWVRVDGSNATEKGQNCAPVIGERAFRVRDGATTATVSLFSATGLDVTVCGGI